MARRLELLPICFYNSLAQPITANDSFFAVMDLALCVALPMELLNTFLRHLKMRIERHSKVMQNIMPPYRTL